MLLAALSEEFFWEEKDRPDMFEAAVGIPL